MFSKKLVGALGAGIAALGIAAAAAPAQAATFTVNNADSGGAGSLRAAIAAAEATNRPDTIEFEIPGQGVHTIALANDLPLISNSLTIRGYSQPGADPATADAPAEPKIVIDAANAGRGLDIGGDGIEVRGLVVKNAQGDGIYVEGENNVIAGNHIGTNAAGDQGRSNGGAGVTVVGRNNVIGGPEPKDRNVISANDDSQVNATDGTGNLVEGNRIGTNAAGKRSLGGTFGITLESSGNAVRDNQVGGTYMGVVVEGDDNTLQGNDVGTKASRKRAQPNTYGIVVRGGDDNLIGGTGEGEGNLVSGNDAAGITLDRFGDDPATGNDLQGNLIGTTYTGRAPLPNGSIGGYAGVAIAGSNSNIVGGAAPGAGNVIASNAGSGVRIRELGADGNHVVGNWIGTNKTARRELGNGASGVYIDSGSDNVVGDNDETAPRNTIMYNGDDGVTVLAGEANAVLGNAMADNSNLGIDLGADGSTANDPNDLDTGANGLQNGPELDEATPTTVEWELETLPQTTYRLEFFACDGPGAGEGATYLGSTSVTTDANGDADDTTTLPTPAEVGDHVGMTATRTTFTGPLGNLVLVPHETSELSPCEEVE